MTEKMWPKDIQAYLDGKLTWEAVKEVAFSYMTFYADETEANAVADRLKKAGAPDFQYRNMQMSQQVDQGPVINPYPSEM